MEQIKVSGELIVWIAGVVGALAMLTKPAVDAAKKRKVEKARDRAKVDVLFEIAAKLMGSRLQEEYRLWTGKGYCPIEEKGQILEMYDLYAVKLKRNHLTKELKENLMELPDHPPKG